MLRGNIVPAYGIRYSQIQVLVVTRTDPTVAVLCLHGLGLLTITRTVIHLHLAHHQFHKFILRGDVEARIRAFSIGFYGIDADVQA
jgi:hypothetical protein